MLPSTSISEPNSLPSLLLLLSLLSLFCFLSFPRFLLSFSLPLFYFPNKQTLRSLSFPPIPSDSLNSHSQTPPIPLPRGGCRARALPPPQPPPPPPPPIRPIRSCTPWNANYPSPPWNRPSPQPETTTVSPLTTAAA